MPGSPLLFLLPPLYLYLPTPHPVVKFMFLITQENSSQRRGGAVGEKQAEWRESILDFPRVLAMQQRLLGESCDFLLSV